MMEITLAVRHVMIKDMLTIEEGSSVSDAIRRMGDRKVGSVVVIRKGKPVGILTERDIMMKCAVVDTCQKTKVEEIMSSPLVTVEIDTPLAKAAKIMREKDIRHLLVTEKGKVVGIVTSKFLLRSTMDIIEYVGKL